MRDWRRIYTLRLRCVAWHLAVGGSFRIWPIILSRRLNEQRLGVRREWRVSKMWTQKDRIDTGSHTSGANRPLQSLPQVLGDPYRALPLHRTLPRLPTLDTPPRPPNQPKIDFFFLFSLLHPFTLQDGPRSTAHKEKGRSWW